MQSKLRIDELDLIRGICMIFVVTLHVFGYFMGADIPGSKTYIVDGLFITMFRFSRQVFMFLTGLVLFYNYKDQDLQLSVFYRKRVKGILLPYVIWSILYIGFQSMLHIEPVYSIIDFV